MNWAIASFGCSIYWPWRKFLRLKNRYIIQIVLHVCCFEIWGFFKVKVIETLLYCCLLKFFFRLKKKTISQIMLERERDRAKNDVWAIILPMRNISYPYTPTANLDILPGGLKSKGIANCERRIRDGEAPILRWVGSWGWDGLVCNIYLSTKYLCMYI